MKIGVISLLAVATVLLAPNLKMPAVNAAYAWQGLGPVVPGTLFPFVFITIACGAVSGFHALISSGTTPKMVSKESETRMIGYGGMLMDPSVLMSSAFIVLMWGYLLYMGVNDPNGGVKALWALFGIANQMLAAVALATVTTVLIKMGRAKYAWVTGAPMAWLVITTFSAAVQRIFHSGPRIGFLALARTTEAKIAAGLVKPENLAAMRTVVFNNRFDAAIGMLLIGVVALIVIESARQWYLLLSGRKRASLAEEPRVPSRLAVGGALAGGSQ